MSTFGKSTIGASFANAVAANFLVANKFTLSDPSGVVSKLSVYVSASKFPLRVFIYADSAGSPGALKAVSAEISVPTTSGVPEWHDFPLSVTIPSGNYWLGYWMSTTNNPALANDAGGSRAYKSGVTYSSTLSPPDPFGTPTGSDSACTYSIYATYAAGVPPVSTGAPVASGAARVGSTVAVTSGLWSDDGSPTFSYQWQDSVNGSTGWANIAAATSATYVIGAGENTKYLQCNVTNTDAFGNTTAASNVLGPVVLTPVCLTVPTLAGVPTVGQVLRSWPGVWADAGSPTFSYQWQRDNSGGGTFTNIGGATSSTYMQVSADNGCQITCIVTDTDSTGATSTTADVGHCATSRTVTWNPTSRQTWDQDTQWLLDPGVEACQFPYNTTNGFGLLDTTRSFIDNNFDPWRVSPTFAVVPGRYRLGLQGTSSSNDWLWSYGIWLGNTSFTVEFQGQSSSNWTGLGGGSGINFLSFGGVLGTLRFCILGNPGVPTLVMTDAAGRNVTLSGPSSPVAGQWVSMAATFNGTTLTFYVDGVSAGTSVMTAPPAWTADERQSGLSIFTGGSTTSLTISDMRISRCCRVPGTPIAVSGTNTVTIADTPTGATVNQNLRAGLHYWAATEAQVTDATVLSNATHILLGRTDKFISACPVKAGGTDGTHPTLGHSGSFSYDFRPLLHTLTYYQSLGVTPYLGFDSNPQLLGGSGAPFTPTQCANTSALLAEASFNGEVPSNFASYATICADHYWYVTQTLGIRVPYWTVGNEPDGGFWGGTQLQFFQLYAAIVAAVHAVDSSANIGGLEFVGTTWLAPFISYCKTNSVPVGFISFHAYTGDLSYFQSFKALLASACSTYSFSPVPPLVNGEFNWQSANVSGLCPTPHMVVGDFGASFTAASMILAQQAGIAVQVFTHLFPAETTDTGYNMFGLISAAKPWATRNVMEVWEKLG